MKEVPSYNIADLNTAKFQNDMLRSYNALLQNVPFLNGIHLENITIGTSPTKIPHKLGRSYRGFFPTNLSSQTHIWIPEVPNPATFIVLQASSSITVNLWVF